MRTGAQADERNSGFYAHTLAGQPIQRWEPLDQHLRQVAELCGSFAAAFTTEDWGRIVGWWHDLGKYSRAFQEYLRRSADQADDETSVETTKVDHSTAGAKHAMRALPRPTNRIVAYCIAGHHAGLLNSGNPASHDPPGTMAHRLHKAIEPTESVPAEVATQPEPRPPSLRWVEGTSADAGFQLAFFGRMLFSCLVDADFLATESFMRPDTARSRPRAAPSWDTWIDRVDHLVESKQASGGDHPVTRHRASVYRRCVDAASSSPGIFSLNVPTGGGKTLASFAFALRHARTHQLGRIIYALPYTSIIEQNAMVLRNVLGPDGDAVLEHHSNLDPATETATSKLASENWDAPVVVTTNVQLLESLFSNRTSQCRKLHRLARSVIILDEAQSVPVELLRPTLAALAELVRNYGCTVVLCTATQPAVGKTADFPIGLVGMREITEDPKGLSLALRRVRLTVVGELTVTDLADRLSELSQVLCIVESRSRAADLHRTLRARGVDAHHLSAAMCPAHRTEVVAHIRRSLDAGRPCRVVSTSVIEAGVDVDFPVVYRALAGLDAIAQAAGRCNREGRMPEGSVYVFIPEGSLRSIPQGHLRQTAAVTLEVSAGCGDLLSLDAIERYFNLYYWKRQADWDRHQVMECFADARTLLFDYAAAAERFRVIPDDYRSVVVPWGDQGDLLSSHLLSTPHVDRDLVRRAQRFSVQIPRYTFDHLLALGEIDERPGRPAVLVHSLRYSQEIGLATDRVLSVAPDQMIV